MIRSYQYLETLRKRAEECEQYNHHKRQQEEEQQKRNEKALHNLVESRKRKT